MQAEPKKKGIYNTFFKFENDEFTKILIKHV